MNASELIFIGIDVAKETLEVAVDDKSKTRCIANGAPEIEALVKELVPLSGRIGVVLWRPREASNAKRPPHYVRPA